LEEENEDTVGEKIDWEKTAYVFLISLIYETEKREKETERGKLENAPKNE
jgi:hypothetical protein